MTTPDLDTIRRDAASDDPETRGRALDSLLRLVRRDPGAHHAALELFRAELGDLRSPFAALSAARGIEHVAGPDEGRDAWLALLAASEPSVVSSAALLVDASYAPVLLGLLAQRREPDLRTSLVRALGRMRNPDAFDPIAACLHDPSPVMRGHAVEALADLDDVRAIPRLESLRSDTAGAWREDNHGPTLRVCDLAGSAIERLQGSAASPALARRATTSRLAYVPLVAALFELPWLGAIVIAVLFTKGHFDINARETQLLDLVALLPPVVGLAAGAAAIARGAAVRMAAWVCLVVGFVVCGLLAFSFGWELFHPEPEAAPQVSARA
jgi:hypothetical protein